MKQSSFILRLIFLLASSASLVLAQSTAREVKSFAQGGLSFDYPANWTLTDKSTAQAQHLILSQAKSSVLIMIVVYRDLISSKDQFDLALGNITNPYLDNIAQNFAAPGHKVEREYPCIEMEGTITPGVRIRGFYQNEQSTGEVYAFAAGRRFVNLIYIRADKDNAQGNAAWETAVKTLKIENPDATTVPGHGYFSDRVVAGGVLNGKAVSLPPPEYSSFAKGARASGTVIVQVTIDENGNVITAKAVTGHPLLRKAAEEAAMRAKFTPTRICEQPVKVTGTISYNFIR